jgi:hypothetical protein
LTRFWLALERLPGQAAVTQYWRHLIRSDFDLASRLMSPDPRLATSFPRLDGRGPDYAVVEHGYDDFVGVCEDDGERTPLSRADLVVYRLDAGKLVAAVAGAFGLEAEGTAVEGLGATNRVGTYRPLAGFAYPVYLTIQLEQPDYKAAVESLVATTPGPFVLLAPTNRHHRIASKLLLDGRGCLFLPLADAIRPDARLWGLTDAARAALDAFTARLIPAVEQPMVLFPTPAGATWAMLRVRFIDGHRVAVSVGGEAQTFNYTQLGMADGRNGNPTKQWELLRVFARNRGTLTWGSKGASRDNQKRKDKLADDLKAFFRIDGEPFRLLAGGKGWQTVFAVEPDA